MRYISKSINETASVAGSVLSRIVPRDRATVLALYGDLGSGKTTFVQQLAFLLGVKEIVQSPTFVIMKTYKLEKTGGEFSHLKYFFHIDAFRLERDIELEHLGWKDIVNDPGNLVAIEWADKIERLLPKDSTKINFKYSDTNKREIEF